MLVYPFMLPLHRFLIICDSKMKNHVDFLENLHFLIDVPLKLITFAILILSTENLFERTLFWYVDIKVEGWNGNILHIKKVSLISWFFYVFVVTKASFKPQLCPNVIDGINMVLHNVSALYFQTTVLIISLVYLEFYALILPFMLFGIFLGIKRLENECIYKSITMLFNPIIDNVNCEISKIIVLIIQSILSLVMVNGGYLIHDKWTIFSNKQINLIIISLCIHGVLNLISSFSRQTREKFSTALNYFTLIMAAVTLFNVLKFSHETEKENVYISFLRKPYQSISIISKGKPEYGEVIISNFIKGIHISDVSKNVVHEMPCFATIRNGAVNQASNNDTTGMFYLENLQQLGIYEGREDIQIFILKNNGTFMPSMPLQKISSKKIILMVAKEDWVLVCLISTFILKCLEH